MEALLGAELRHPHIATTLKYVVRRAGGGSMSTAGHRSQRGSIMGGSQSNSAHNSSANADSQGLVQSKESLVPLSGKRLSGPHASNTGLLNKSNLGSSKRMNPDNQSFSNVALSTLLEPSGAPDPMTMIAASQAGAQSLYNGRTTDCFSLGGDALVAGSAQASHYRNSNGSTSISPDTFEAQDSVSVSESAPVSTTATSEYASSNGGNVWAVINFSVVRSITLIS